MTGQAQITSVEAIESFRGKLIVYLTQARSVLDEAASRPFIRGPGFLARHPAA